MVKEKKPDWGDQTQRRRWEETEEEVSAPRPRGLGSVLAMNAVPTVSLSAAYEAWPQRPSLAWGGGGALALCH